MPCPLEGMKTYTISKFARLFGLSRSTLLYYDRIGLLVPSDRTPSGYRVYTEEDVQRLERICSLRRTGMSLEDIRTILASEDEPDAVLFEKRLKEINEEILGLKAKQGLLSGILNGMTSEDGPPKVNKEMDRWHAEVEPRAPDSHHEFLLSLGIPEEEVLLIRQWSRKVKPG